MCGEKGASAAGIDEEYADFWGMIPQMPI